MKLSKTYFFTATAAAAIFLTVACKKLPKETHKGKDMMACYVNGEKWKAKNKISFDMSTIGSGSGGSNPEAGFTGTTSWYIQGTESKLGGLVIYINNFKGIGDYELTTPSYQANYAGYNGGHKSDSLNKGIITIKYFSNNIIAGTFSFTLKDNQGETVAITQGRFDIKYK